ncbi:PRC-barrel domain-containing protein [Azospirillum picis]|uniref:Sporulation protein YlmC with PRC-barrel domain n=1 Tax=Azospirillum picis TaxID=488438 RepID=A0ABU0MIM1_9PROT|nr:PRC-barrel domain-containing protein [Azospirillum picis]MBP2299586.1 sporulation protein YlmC with PRC-barrel domain [Azospirillum picis]MDQ0533287.1 sporulation protein YlmC with PRC-barrel domain [Azospirillum picis]
MKRPTLGTALLLAALGPLSVAAPALAADDCTAGLDRLGQQAAALEAAGPNSPAPVTPQETAQLRALQQAAQSAAQKGNAPACQAILGEAAALQESIAHPRAMAADDLEDAKLRSPDGKDLGSISELVIDPGTGRVAYAVVELGGFLGIGEADFAVPWALFSASGDGYVLNVPKDKLTNAPRFDDKNRPNMNDRQWAMAVHTYYGVPPYWMRDSATLAAIAGTTAGGGDTAAAPLRQEVQRLSQEVARLNRELEQARGAAGSSGAPAQGQGDGAAGSASGTATGSGAASGNGSPQPPVSQQ